LRPDPIRRLLQHAGQLPGDSLLGELLRDLESAGQGIIDEAMIDRGAAWIEQMRQEFPLVYNFIQSALHKGPQDILIALALRWGPLKVFTGNQAAIKYVGMIQQRLLRAEDSPQRRRGRQGEWGNG
jgi:hypothetical protein